MLFNFSEAETKLFVTKLKSLLTILLGECPSTAHSLLNELLCHGLFFVNCLEAMITDISDAGVLCGLLVEGLCISKRIEIHLPFIVSLSQTDFRYQLFLLLIGMPDYVHIIYSVIEEERKLLENNSRDRLNEFLENGLEPLKSFNCMLTKERHFLFEILVSVVFYVYKLFILFNISSSL